MEKCKCRKCSNTINGEKKLKSKSCRCGEERKAKDPGFVSCIDIEGKKRTRCPCFSTRQGCSERCRCFNCNNSFGSPIKINKVSQPKRKKQLSSPPSLKRPRGTQYLRDCGMTTVSEGWTRLETCLLHMVESFLYTTCVPPTKENILKLYNYVIASNTAIDLQISGNTKSLKQISGKLEYLSKRQEELRCLNLGVHAVL